MGRLDIILTFARYEIRRAIARRKVLTLIAFTVLLDIVPYYALSIAMSSLIPLADRPFIWIIGVFAVQPLFLNFTAILIAAGAMSEEYEQGTAELLLSKPVNRGDFFAGKFLGGFLLFLSILFINIFLNVSSAYAVFGEQLGLLILPSFFFVQAFSSMLFYTLALMLGELMRRSSLAYIFSSALFFSSLIINIYMGAIYQLTGDVFYNNVRIYLPTSPADSLPLQYAIPMLPQNLNTIIQLVSANNIVEPSITFSLILVIIYVGVGLAIAASYFRYADISRKVS